VWSTTGCAASRRTSSAGCSSRPPPATGWLIVAVGLCALFVWIGAMRARPALRAGVIAAALVVCLGGQVAMLGYALQQELHGTSTAPGGIALTADRALDREEWVDATLPDDATAALVPPLATIPSGYSEAVWFWSKDLDATVSLPWNGAAVPVPPGTGLMGTEVGANGLAAWQGTPPQWIITPRNDPRVQFTGRIAATSPNKLFQAVELSDTPTAAWTGTGLDASGGIAVDQPATLTLDREQLPEVRDVTLSFGSLGGPGPSRWRVLRDGETVSTGRVVPGSAGTATLRVPPCAAGDPCDPAVWEVHAIGAGGLRLDAAELGS
jgi:hypothetical protein